MSLDEQQVGFLKEQCILVDNDDKPLGPVSKEECHKNSNIKSGMLHRAFSVFLFNTKGQLLLHQRASSKITFPDYWTNSCCSHPLYVADEMETKDQLGVKRAARRKLEHELGIPPKQLPLSDIHFLTRIHYKAPSDGEWGEHEIDYILFVQRDLSISPNPNEIGAIRWVTPKDLRELFAQQRVDPKLHISPWFQLIAECFFFKWWDRLAQIIEAKGINETPGQIHRLSLSSSSADSKSDGKQELEQEKEVQDDKEQEEQEEEQDEEQDEEQENEVSEPSRKKRKKIAE